LLTAAHPPGAVKVGELIAQLAIVLLVSAAAWSSLRDRW
jgi:hypothetical protein